MSATIRVTLPDGSVREVPSGTTSRQVAEGIGAGLARAALAARVNGSIWDLDRPLEADATLAILTERDPDALELLRHSSAHIMATAVRELFPERGHRVRPADRGRLLLRLPGGPPVHARGPRADRGQDGRGGGARLPVHPGGRGPRGGQPALRGRSAQARAHRGAGRRRDHHGLHRRPVPGPLPRAAHPPHRPAQALQAALRRRRLLAGRRAPPDAPADLRHGLVQEGGARRLPPPARGGEEARPPAAGQGAGPVHVPPVRPGRAVLHRPRHHDRAGDQRLHPRASTSARATRRSRRRCCTTRGCGRSRATGASTGRTCSWCSTRRRASTTSRSSR